MNIYKSIIGLFVAATFFVACDSALDLEPQGNQQAATIDSLQDYEGLWAKLYAGLIVGGQGSGDGNADIQGIDGGFSNYSRLYWKLQELSTDEAIIAWNDGTIKDLHWQTWTPGNEFLAAMFARITYQVTLCNSFLRLSTDAELDANGIPQGDRAAIRSFRNEARFLRAYSYYHGMDLFGTMPFTTEANAADGSELPAYRTRAELFAFIESELLAIENDMSAPAATQYGRAGQGAVWMTLSKLYLNAEVYTGTSRYDDVITFTNKVIAGGYNVNTAIPYRNSFLADNDSNGAQSEFIWTANYDGARTQTFGGTTFLSHAPVGGDMNAADYGLDSGWGGIRTTPQFVELFPGEENSLDLRENFFTADQNKSIADVGRFKDGYAIVKFQNITSTGNPGVNPTFVSTDFPVFRLADAYLMYAEATLRGAAGGNTATAVGYINTLRTRAYGNTSGNITAGQLNLNFILDERARELHWEGHRRQDLIRFNRFTSNGVWEWKGNVQSGTTTAPFRNLYPIPNTELRLNSNLIQNPGY
jgi:hypothetical protein